MKEVRLYECGICHNRFSDQANAKECELQHRREDTIIGSEYEPFNFYPSYLTVSFKDGTTGRYKRMRGIQGGMR